MTTPAQRRASRRAAMTGITERRPASRPVIATSQQPPATMLHGHADAAADDQLARMRARLAELGG